MDWTKRNGRISKNFLERIRNNSQIQRHIIKCGYANASIRRNGCMAVYCIWEKPYRKTGAQTKRKQLNEFKIVKFYFVEICNWFKFSCWSFVCLYRACVPIFSFCFFRFNSSPSSSFFALIFMQNTENYKHSDHLRVYKEDIP